MTLVLRREILQGGTILESLAHKSTRQDEVSRGVWVESEEEAQSPGPSSGKRLERWERISREARGAKKGEGRKTRQMWCPGAEGKGLQEEGVADAVQHRLGVRGSPHMASELIRNIL